MREVEKDPQSKLFPMACPECDANAVDRELRDDLVHAVISAASFWRCNELREEEQRLRFWCPAPRCRAMILVHPDQAKVHVCADVNCLQRLCIPCRAVGHPSMSCAQYRVSETPETRTHVVLLSAHFRQALPLGERSPEDVAIRKLAKANGWARCPSCQAMIERVDGCPLMQCR